MTTVAFLFPGQGSQKVGMGAEIREQRPEVFDKYFSPAEEASGLPLGKLCADGPQEDLTSTDVAQPALFALSLAVAELAGEAGLEPTHVAGHSLGEYTASVAAGSLPFDVGVRLVSQRGALMAGAQNEVPGAMAAIIGLDADGVEQLCAEASAAGTVAPANFNTPSQLVCSGEEAGILKLIELAEAAGARKALRLQVGAAFHSELMRPVQSELAETMDGLSWADPRVPLAGNASGQLRTTAAEVHEALVAQIASPVRWVDCVRTLIGAGCDTFVELGPGRVLGGLVRQIDPEVKTLSADGPTALAKVAEELAA